MRYRMFRIGKTFTFDAAHKLPDHDGKCRHLHGHTYKVEVVLVGEHLHLSGPQQGMLLDFDVVKKVWSKIEPEFDHQFLNESLQLKNPTAEELARVLYDSFVVATQVGVKLESVTVWETPTSWASYVRS